MSRIRTDVETLFLSEMVEDDNMDIMYEDAIDDIIPSNTVGIFDDTTSSDNGLIDNDDVDLYSDEDNVNLFWKEDDI